VLWVRSYSVCDLFVANGAEASEYGRRTFNPHLQGAALCYRGRWPAGFRRPSGPRTTRTPPWVFYVKHPAGDYAETLTYLGSGRSGTLRAVEDGYAFNTLF
jgi:hypothetical protein